MSEDTQQQDEQLNNSEVNIEKLENDLNEAMNGWKRTAADFENYKRQKEKENKELVQFAREVTVAKLLPTLDVLGQALKHLPEYNLSGLSAISPQEGRSSASDTGIAAEPPSPPEERGRGEVAADFEKKYKNWQVGIKGILMQLDQALVELGVKKIEAIGKKFDPHLHEAVKEVESDEEDGIIVDELLTGFELNGKVIRPSQVVVSKKLEPRNSN